jgi:hypothetical protein
MDPCLAGRQASFRLGSEFRMTEKEKVKNYFSQLKNIPPEKDTRTFSL